MNLLKKLFGTTQTPSTNNSNYSPSDIGKYYDEWTERYLDVSEEIIQAYRPKSTVELMKYFVDIISIQDGQQILDAGCGTGGPAIYFASNKNVVVNGLTISKKQTEILAEKAANAKLMGSVDVQLGDYHHLNKYYKPKQFDHVLFLESLGHAADFRKVLESAKNVMKPGGKIYIKDFFICMPNSSKKSIKNKKIIENINKIYIYNTLELNPVIDWFRANDFQLNYIQSPKYENDPAIRAEFEYRNKIDLFEGMQEFMPADWYEMQWVKR